MEPERLIEGFRRAAFGMGTWQDALAAYGSSQRANIVQLVGIDAAGGFSFGMMHGVGPDEEAAYFRLRGDDPAHNPRTRAAIRGAPLRTVIDSEIMDPRDRDAYPIFRELFARTGADVISLMPLAVAGSFATLCAMRGRTAGEPSAEERRLSEAIGPALSAIMNQALWLGTSIERLMLDTAGTLAEAVLLLDRVGRPVAMTAAAEAVLARGTHLTLRAGSVAARSPADAALLDRALGLAGDPRAALSGAARHLLHGLSGDPPMMIEIAPAPARASGPFHRASAILAIRTPRPPEERLLRDAFRLTPAEAQVALMLAAGKDMAQIAVARGCALATVRVQLRQLLAKTGSARQAELVARLHRLM